MTVQLRELGPNDPCFCGSGKKLKKCCKLRGYWTAPGILISERKYKQPWIVALLTVATESDVRVTPDMNELAITRALPPEVIPSALLDCYSISLPTRIYEDAGVTLHRNEFGWF